MAAAFATEFSRLQKEIAGRDDAERKKAIHRRSRFFRHSRVTRRGLPDPKGGAAQAIGLRDHDRHRTPGRAVQGGDHAIVVRSTRCWREQDSNHRFRGRRPASSWCRLSFAPTFPRAGSQAEVMSRRRKLGRVTRNQWFESGFLQRRVHQTSPATLQTRGVGSPREWVFVHKWLLERKRSYLTEKGLFSRKAVKGDATEPINFIKEESHGTRSTPHR